VRATQFFESIGGIADFSTREHVVHLTTAAMQPMASADVAEALADTVLEAPLNGMKEISGPERAPLAEFAFLTPREHRQVPDAGYNLPQEAPVIFVQAIIDFTLLTYTSIRRK
jgi:uncharacterized protein YbjT (DUF2867 family)